MEALSTMLRSLRLRSAILSRAALRGRWGVQTEGIPMLFHGVLSGQAVIRLRSGEEAVLNEGDMVLLPTGEAHAMLSDARATAVPISSLPKRREGAVPLLSYGPPGAETRLICGVFHLEHPAAGSILSLMPGLLCASPAEPARRAWAKATLELLDAEVCRPDAQATTVSLADALLVHLLVSARIEQPSGLLAAASDEQIARALALVHEAPGHPWTVPLLAERAGMSRTRFFERFTELVGEPPARYLARWRAMTAADLMRSKKGMSTAEIAGLVGYSSEDALARVFKRYLQASPARYRRGLDAVSLRTPRPRIEKGSFSVKEHT